MKSKIFAVCMVMALLLTCMFAVPAQAAPAFPVAKGDRAVLNGDFSDGAEGWVISSGGVGEEENGNKFGQITAKGANIVSPSINVTPGETITWEFDYRAGETTNNTLGFRFCVVYFGANGEEYAGDPPNHVAYMGVADDWTRASYNCKVPAGVVRASMRINCHAAAEGVYVDIDNVVAVWTPTLNEAVYNGNMEVVQDNMPKGYTASGDNVTIEKVKTHSGKTAVKITNTTDTTSYVSLPVYARTTGASESGVTGTDFSAWMNLTEFEDDPADAADGVRLELYFGGVYKAGTGWFVQTKDEEQNDIGWRKMMICWNFVRNTGLFDMRVTLNGKGTVYVDDFDTHTAGFIRNGDFEGFESEGVPAGWTKQVSSVLWGEQLKIVREPGTDNHYLSLINVGQGQGVKTYDASAGYYNSLFEVGNRYKLSMDIKSGAGGTYGVLGHTSGAIEGFNAGAGLGTTGATGQNWFNGFTYYFAAPKPADAITLYCRWASSTGGQCFDNIVIEPVTCETAFYDANGNKVTKAEPGKAYTAKYVGYGKNYSTTTESAPVSLIYALYEKLEDGSVRLASVTLEKGTAKYVGTKAGQNLASATVISVQGQPPLELTGSAITIPNDGKTYELRAYTWDDFTSMTPYYASISA